MLKANTTELHPKVRPTCIFYNIYLQVIVTEDDPDYTGGAAVPEDPRGGVVPGGPNYVVELGNNVEMRADVVRMKIIFY